MSHARRTSLHMSDRTASVAPIPRCAYSRSWSSYCSESRNDCRKIAGLVVTPTIRPSRTRRTRSPDIKRALLRSSNQIETPSTASCRKVSGNGHPLPVNGIDCTNSCANARNHALQARILSSGVPGTYDACGTRAPRPHPRGDTGGDALLASDRRREIFNRLVREGYVEAKELAEELGVDASTIRRDLDALARSGQVKRTHGGARTVPGVSADLPYSMKETARLDQKAAVAGVAVRRVRDGDTVVVDTGSTTYEIAVRLRDHEDLTVITNDLRIATFIADLRRFRLLVAGGELLGSVYTLTGRRTVEFLLDYAADWTFLGADAVDAAAGITNTNTLEIPVKRAMLEVAATP